MALSPNIESFYTKAKRGVWACDDLMAVAKECEEWFLSDDLVFDWLEPRVTAADRAGEIIPTDKMVFAMAMALCIPSEKTGDLFKLRHAILWEDANAIGKWVVDISAVIEQSLPEHNVDVLTAFSHLKDRSVSEVARRCYAADMMEVQRDAAGWDNLDVFLKTLPEDPDKAREPALSMLARFPEHTGTAIYRYFVRNAGDERDLFRAQVNNLRHSLMGDYYDNMSWVVNKGPKYPTLLPNSASVIPHFAPDAASEIFMQPDFADKVRMDAEHLVRDFFHRTDEALRNPENAPHVHQITKAFIEAGIPPVAIISWCVFRRKVSEPMVPLPLALGEYAAMGLVEQDFYAQVYRQFLKDFSPTQIAESCFRDETFESAYRLTGDKSILKNARSRVRDACFGSDLGL